MFISGRRTRLDKMVARFHSLYYALKEYKEKGGATLIMGAGCSLSSTKKDISTIGIMKDSLREHGIAIDAEEEWDKIYSKFIDIVWISKSKEEQRELLNKRLADIHPSDGHKYLKALISEGYITTVITTNFDMLIEDACQGMTYYKSTGGTYQKIGHDSTGFYLLKVHGDLESGQLRFSPADLMKLPNNVSEDIFNKTRGLTLFLGYRGQDIGLMNSICNNSVSSMFWIDYNGPYLQPPSEAQIITKLLSSRESNDNILSGSQYGDFQTIISELHSILVLKNHRSLIDTQKHYLISKWMKTSIWDILSINTHLYNLFLDILYCAKSISESLAPESDTYDSYINSFLYVFKNGLIPSKLIQIPNNEIDALILGVSFEIITRAYCSNISIDGFTEKLINHFSDEVNNNVVFDSSFWDTIKTVVNTKNADIKETTINFQKEHLIMESYEIPLSDIVGLTQIVKILSSVSFLYNDKFRAFFGKEKSVNCFNNKIYIDLGDIESEDNYFVNDSLIKTLPSYQTYVIEEQINIVSKWLEIKFRVLGANILDDSIFKTCINNCKKTTQEFLMMGIASEKKHVKLQLDYDISDFSRSKKTAMFITGISGSGKTSSLRYFISENPNNYYSIVSSKINAQNTIALSTFIGIEISENEEESVIKTIDNILVETNTILFFVIDGINELSYSSQIQYYKTINELAHKLHKNTCCNIKVICTCREHAYYQYKNSTSIFLDHAIFYRNDKFEYGIEENQDANYRVKDITNYEYNTLLECYITEKRLIPIVNSLTLKNLTPFYFSLINEYLQAYPIESLDLNKNNALFELLSFTLLKRLSKTNQYLAQKILYEYFDLVINNRSWNITRFMLENHFYQKNKNIDIDSIEDIIVSLFDINILMNDISRHQQIKFSHDKIEAFFFGKYLEEYAQINDDSISRIIDLCSKNLIYQEGFTQYLIYTAQVSISEFKKIITTDLINNIGMIPKTTIEVIANLNNIDKDLEYLLHESDYINSKNLINIIITGLDDSVTSFSLITFDMMKVINAIINISNKIVSDDVIAYMYYFKSRLYYFNNNYKDSIIHADNALRIVDDDNYTLVTRINLHKAVVLMEQGYSTESIEILKKEYNLDNPIIEKVKIGIELGRAYNHNGKTIEPLKLYKTLLQCESQITKPYFIARICEQKGNTLNKIMYEKLNYGFKSNKDLSSEDIQDINKLFKDALFLYDKAMKLLIAENEVFCYSGVVPEKINTYISYSMSIAEEGITECKSLIDSVDVLFDNITTPFKTDFNIAKAYYYEYLGDIEEALKCINIAMENAIKLEIQNKKAKCNLFYSQFAYRRLLRSDCFRFNSSEWQSIGINSANDALLYYQKYTDNTENYNIRACNQMIILLEKDI